MTLSSLYVFPTVFTSKCCWLWHLASCFSGNNILAQFEIPYRLRFLHSWSISFFLFAITSSALSSFWSNFWNDPSLMSLTFAVLLELCSIVLTLEFHLSVSVEPFFGNLTCHLTSLDLVIRNSWHLWYAVCGSVCIATILAPVHFLGHFP